MEPLSRRSLRRVVQSLLTAQLSQQRKVAASDGRVGSATPLPAGLSADWADDLRLDEAGPGALGCDSLELLQLSSAANEMFHLYEAGLETDLLQKSLLGRWLDLIEEAWRGGVDRITVTTSGSTGKPKFCTHNFASLHLEVQFLAELFSSRKRVVLYTPAHHIYGLLFGALLPDRLKASVVDLPALAPRQDGGSRRQKALQAGDLIVSFPEGWDWIERNMRTMPADVEGVTATAPCPQALKDALMTGRLSRLVEVYGSSETAGLGTRVWPATVYTLMPHLRRVATAPGEPDGDNPLQNSLGQKLTPMDELLFSGERTFEVLGRKDSCVQVGGVNVSPLRIAHRLREQPGVADAAVRLQNSKNARLKCFIVPAKGSDTEQLGRSLREGIAHWPEAAERPVEIQFGPQLPRDASGKLSDW